MREIKKINSIREKILFLLAAGISLGFTFSPKKHYKILKIVDHEWKKINERKLKQEIRNLYRSHLIDFKENPDGSFTYVLTDKGKIKVLTYNFQNMKIEKGNWDGKWRLITFDIPEKLRKRRDALRQKLKELGFYEIQKSVFVFPYECKNEIDFVIEFFNLRKFVRYGVLESIDNDLHLKKIYNFI